MKTTSFAARMRGALQRAVQFATTRPGATPARLGMGARSIHAQALACLLLVSSAAHAATPPNTTITNTATASFSVGGVPMTARGAVDVTTAARTPATIDFLRYTPAGSSPTASLEAVAATQCSTSGTAAGPFTTAPTPKLAGSTDPLPVPGPTSLAPAQTYGGGEPLFIKVTDYDQNRDPLVAETIIVTVSSDTGDRETLRVTETGPSTGVFIGYLQSTRTPNPLNNCQLSVSSKGRLSVSYIDPFGGEPVVSDAALVDPFGLVFDSSTGNAVNGARVTLIDMATGLPAKVYCPDTVSPYPSTMITGTPFAACGGIIDLPAGNYQFPLVAASNYRLEVAPPPGYRFASTVATDKLQQLPGAPFVIVVGSRGETFPVNAGPAVNIDVPLDPAQAQLQITKTAAKAVIGLGEFVPYTVAIRNESTTSIARSVRIDDRLPAGFRYRAGSARRVGAAITEPTISGDGRTLSFAVGDIAPGAAITLKYVAEVTIEAPPGKAENTAVAVGDVVSNTARASVTVQDDFMRARSLLVGRVIVGACDAPVNETQGLANARILLEDGTYILTDKDGRWHADNVRPGTHVVQLDLASLPSDLEVLACNANARFAGRNYSQFVNLRSGTLWRADFHVAKKSTTPSVTQQLAVQRNAGGVEVTLRIGGGADVRNVVAALTPSAQPIAGSARLNGAPLELEDAGGAWIARLPARQGVWADVISFKVDAPGEVQVASLVRFVPPGRQGVALPLAQAMLAAGDKAPIATASTAAPIVQAEPHRETASAPGTQDRGQRTQALVADAPPQVPGSDRRDRLVEQLPYDADWLMQAQPGAEWLHPQTSFQPAVPSIKIAVKHAPQQTVALSVNGKEVNAVKLDGTLFNTARTVALSTWRGVALTEGDNRIELVVREADGREALRQSRSIHYSHGPDKVVFVPEHSRLVADGKTRPIVALRFLDKDGRPVRRGVSGEFELGGAYASANQLEAIQREPLAGKIDNKPRFEIGHDGIALVELAPTTQSGEALLKFTFGEQHRQELRVWLQAAQRDWVLVGFAEGTVGHKRLSGNAQAQHDSGDDERLFDGNRLAFYAKGTIKGEYLLTIAYDSAKQRGDPQAAALKQAIDPTRDYTLYADATQAAYDAASVRKLYVKIERRQFYALFGDFDTGLTVTEFARYSRTVNGLKSEYRGERVGYNAFVTQTSQAYVKDEVAGDGTSGLYQLSRRDILENSAKVRIESRDRFETHKVLATRTLSRFLDYDLDALRGTLFFKSPVPVRDENFNPVFIVAEYETTGARDEKLIAGGRASVKPADGVEVGATLVSDGTVGAKGALAGLDARVEVNSKLTLTGEYAASNRTLAGQATRGDAWKVEATHRDQKIDATAYVRQQDGAFGLGQQAAQETGTRKAGVDVKVQVSETIKLQGQATHLEVTGGNATRDMVEGRVEQTLGQGHASYGARVLRERDEAGATHDGTQLLGSINYPVLDRKVLLRANAEVGVGNPSQGSLAFPDRLVLGADYQLTEHSKLFAEHELTRSDLLSGNATRAGIRTRPWLGAEMAASLGNQQSLDSGRLFANLGLVQKWQLNEFWQADAGIDRVQTMRGSGAAPATGSALPAGNAGSAGDYTALSLGANYNDKIWGANARLEWRDADNGDKINLLLGVQRNLDAGRVLAAGLALVDARSAEGHSRRVDARLSYAHRPADSKFVWFNRLDYIDSLISTPTDTSQERKLVNSTHVNWLPRSDFQFAAVYGAKYVFDRIDGQGFGGYTDLIGVELRYDITADWEIGMQASRLTSWRSGTTQRGLGVSLGYRLMTNAWLALGYNFRGFDDDDFGAAQYRAGGLYAALRVKFDQDSLRLNARDRAQIDAKP